MRVLQEIRNAENTLPVWYNMVRIFSILKIPKSQETWLKLYSEMCRFILKG
jgi:hypothetical protein